MEAMDVSWIFGLGVLAVIFYFGWKMKTGGKFP
jgi:ABC-type multidrug transport system permease subunit